MTKKILAKDLKADDKIIIPANQFHSERQYSFIGNPIIDGLYVRGFAYRIKKDKTLGYKTPIQFGRMVELEIERPQ